MIIQPLHVLVFNTLVLAEITVLDQVYQLIVFVLGALIKEHSFRNSTGKFLQLIVTGILRFIGLLIAWRSWGGHGKLAVLEMGV